MPARFSGRRHRSGQKNNRLSPITVQWWRKPACARCLARPPGFWARTVDYMVPNRFDNGYGLTPEIVRQAKAHHQTDIILTVDNGIASLKGIEEALASGMQVLVTDHHLPGDELPQNCIVVNPNQPGCPFPSKNLAGVGVMFYVLLALRAEMRRRKIFDEKTQPASRSAA